MWACIWPEGLSVLRLPPGRRAPPIPGDRTKAYITLGILIVAALLFVTEALPAAHHGHARAVGLSSTGVLTSKVAFSYFGDNTVVLFMAMFIIGESTFVTGFADRVGQMALKLSKGDMKKLLLFSMIAVGACPPCFQHRYHRRGRPHDHGHVRLRQGCAEQDFVPVAFASSLGGTVTLVGTPPKRHHQLHA